MKNNNQPILKKPCQYSYTGCQKTAVGQRILKLGTVTIDKG
jgi:hypothetical protein